MKIFPWNATGILYFKEVSLCFIGENNSGHKIELVGRKMMKNGAITWFLINDKNYGHYFTSETGLIIINSQKTTQKIFNDIVEKYDN